MYVLSTGTRMGVTSQSAMCSRRTNNEGNGVLYGTVRTLTESGGLGPSVVSKALRRVRASVSRSVAR